MIVSESVFIKWHYGFRKYYESRGYEFTEKGKGFKVAIKDLLKGSNVKVQFICDYCNGDNQITEESKWKSYREIYKQREKVNKDCCNNVDCTKLKISEFKNKQVIPHGGSFGEVYPHLLIRWSSKNQKTPYDYSFGSHHEVWWICDKGHEWKAIIKNVGRGDNCPYCKGSKVCLDNCLATNYPEVSKDWHPTLNGKLTPYDVTPFSNIKVWWYCKVCKNEWESLVSARTRSKGCANCNASKGEQRVRRWLENNKIVYYPQKEFSGLLGIGGGLLSYDFYLPSFNLLIEYQGQFHDGNGGKGNSYVKKNLKYQQEHDKRKKEYADHNNIELLEIWYWDYENIEEILSKKLSE